MAGRPPDQASRAGLACCAGPPPCRAGPPPCRADPPPCRADPPPCRADRAWPADPPPCRAGPPPCRADRAWPADPPPCRADPPPCRAVRSPAPLTGLAPLITPRGRGRRLPLPLAAAPAVAAGLITSALDRRIPRAPSPFVVTAVAPNIAMALTRERRAGPHRDRWRASPWSRRTCSVVGARRRRVILWETAQPLCHSVLRFRGLRQSSGLWPVPDTLRPLLRSWHTRRVPVRVAPTQLVAHRPASRIALDSLIIHRPQRWGTPVCEEIPGCRRARRPVSRPEWRFLRSKQPSVSPSDHAAGSDCHVSARLANR